MGTFDGEGLMSKTGNYIIALAIIFTMLVCPVIAFASDISGALYYGTIVISNTSATAAPGVSANFSCNTTAMINAGFLNNSANNCAIRSYLGEDAAFMPGWAPNPWIVWAGELAGNQIVNYTLYTTNVTGGKIRYFPGTNGMAVSDNDTLEISNNGTINFSGYIDTAAGENKTITQHWDITNGGVKIIVSPTVSQNVTARVITSRLTTTANITPDSAGTLTQLTPNAGANYQCVDDPINTPDDLATCVYKGFTTAYYWDSYNLISPSFLGFSDSIIINSVTVVFRVYQDGVTGYAKPIFRLGSSNITGTEVATSGTWTTKSENLTRPGGGNWTFHDFDNLQAGIGLRNATNSAICTQVYVQINYSVDIGIELNVTSIPSGEYLTRFIADGTNMWLSVGSSNSANVSVVNIPNSTADWQFGSANTTPYVEYASVDKAGVPVSRWKWEYGATFYDSIGDNDATPTFRTASSDSDVAAYLASFLPLSQAQASPEITAGNQPWSAAPPKPPGFTSPTGDVKVPIIGPIITSIIEDVQIRTFLWYFLSFLVIYGGGLLAIRFGKSIVLKGFVMGALMLGGALSNVYGIWTLIAFGCYAFGIIIMSRHYGFG